MLAVAATMRMASASEPLGAWETMRAPTRRSAESSGDQQPGIGGRGSLVGGDRVASMMRLWIRPAVATAMEGYTCLRFPLCRVESRRVEDRGIVVQTEEPPAHPVRLDLTPVLVLIEDR
jgi:hypothetical protein